MRGVVRCGEARQMRRGAADEARRGKVGGQKVPT